MSTVRGAGQEAIGRVRSSHRDEGMNEFAAAREAYLKQLQKRYGVDRATAYRMMEERGGLGQVRADLADKPKAEAEDTEMTLRDIARRQRARQAALGV